MPSLSDLTLAARRKADLENSNFIRSDEATEMINSSAAELYGLLCNSYEDQFTEVVSFSVASTDGYSLLPTDFFRLRGIDFQTGGQWVPCHRFTFEDRNVINRPVGYMFGSADDIRYRVTGNRVWFTPTDASGGNYRMWYIPIFTPMVLPTDPLNSNLMMNYWYEYIILDAAIKMAVKEDSTELAEALNVQKAAMKKRIEEEGVNRDAAYPETVIDVHSWRDIDGLGWYSN